MDGKAGQGVGRLQTEPFRLHGVRDRLVGAGFAAEFQQVQVGALARGDGVEQGAQALFRLQLVGRGLSGVSCLQGVGADELVRLVFAQAFRHLGRDLVAVLVELEAVEPAGVHEVCDDVALALVHVAEFRVRRHFLLHVLDAPARLTEHERLAHDFGEGASDVQGLANARDALFEGRFLRRLVDHLRCLRARRNACGRRVVQRQGSLRHLPRGSFHFILLSFPLAGTQVTRRGARAV